MEGVQRYVATPGFLQALELPKDTKIELFNLGQGEYNANFWFVHPRTGQKLVLRINTGSQMHLEDQIVYEFEALRHLAPSGRTPRALFYDDSRKSIPYGVLVMEWLPGRSLRYETDLPVAAEILADIHSLPVPTQGRMLQPEFPLLAMYEECQQLAQRYLTWENASAPTATRLEKMVEQMGCLPLKEPMQMPPTVISTELNSGNFLINPEGHSYLVDWEKPILGEAAQDLAHFLAPTTTFWKTDLLLTSQQMEEFVEQYRTAVKGRMDLSALSHRLALYLKMNCLRGISWCAMAAVEYGQPGRAIQNADTKRKLEQYLSPAFMDHIQHTYL